MFNQIKKKFDSVDSKWKIGGLIGVAALAGFLYFHFGPPHQTPKTEPKKVAIRHRSSLRPLPEAQQSPEKDLIKVINKVKKSFGEGQKIENQTIKAIFLGQYELSKKQFQQLTLKHRSERRKFISDFPKYREISRQYDQSLEQLHSRHLNAILAHFRIDRAAWMEIIEEISAKNKQEWEAVLKQGLAEELSQLRIKDKPRIHKDILINIYKFKSRYLQDNAETFNTIADIQTVDLYTLIDEILHDKVFQQFKVEQEDILFSEKQLSQAEAEDLQKYEDEYLDVLKGLILNIEDEEEYEEEIDGRDQA